MTMPQPPHNAQGQVPRPFMIIGGAVALLALFVYFRSKQSGVATVANAGTSINAALGSLQEEQLNTMGAVGMARRDLLDSQNTIGSSLASSTNNGMSAISGQLTQANTAIAKNALDVAAIGSNINDGFTQDHVALHQLTAVTGTN